MPAGRGTPTWRTEIDEPTTRGAPVVRRRPTPAPRQAVLSCHSVPVSALVLVMNCFRAGKLDGGGRRQRRRTLVRAVHRHDEIPHKDPLIPSFRLSVNHLSLCQLIPVRVGRGDCIRMSVVTASSY